MKDSCGFFSNIEFSIFFHKHNAQLNLLLETDFYVHLIN